MILYSGDTFLNGAYLIKTLPIYPFIEEGDSDTIIYVETWRINNDLFPNGFADAILDLDVPNVNDSSATRVGQSDAPRDVGGGDWEFDVHYARVPKSRVLYEPYGWSKPGLNNVVGTVKTLNIVSAVVELGPSPTGGTLFQRQADLGASGIVATKETVNGSVRDAALISITGHGFNAGDRIDVSVVFASIEQDTDNPRLSRSTISKEIISVPDANSLTILFTFSNISWPDSLTGPAYERDPEPVQVHSLLEFDYFATVNPEQDIPIIRKPVILNASGRKTDIYSDNTVPTVTEYESRIAQGDYLVAEDSTYKRWRGNIYERKTRYVRAI